MMEEKDRNDMEVSDGEDHPEDSFYFRFKESITWFFATFKWHLVAIAVCLAVMFATRAYLG